MHNSDDQLETIESSNLTVISHLRRFVEEEFEDLDQNQDGFLSREELLKALFDPGRSTRELSFINFLINRLREISLAFEEEGDGKIDCISRLDVQHYFDNLVSETANSETGTGE